MSKLFIAYALFLSFLLGSCNFARTSILATVFKALDDDGYSSGSSRGYYGGGYHK